MTLIKLVKILIFYNLNILILIFQNYDLPTSSFFKDLCNL